MNNETKKSLGIGIGTGAGAEIIGMGLSPIKNAIQRSQARKLQDIQISGNKEMAEFNQALALDTWDKTNYNAQVGQMKKAGLNPGLMYGMGGGGGATMGGGGAGVSGQAAAVPESGMGIHMGLKAMETAANIKVAESQAKLNEVEANKRANVDTEEAKQRIFESGARMGLMAQQTKNEELKGAILGYERDLAATKADEASRSLEDNLRLYKAAADKAEGEAMKAGEEGKAAAQIIKQNLAEQSLRMTALKAGVAQTEMNTKEGAAKISKIYQEMDMAYQDNWRQWKLLGQGNRELDLKAQEVFLKKLQTEFNISDEQMEKLKSETLKNYWGGGR